MQTPQENPSGYDENSPLFHTEKLKGNYLIVHGTGDDNVHVQNAYRMTNALIKEKQGFRPSHLSRSCSWNLQRTKYKAPPLYKNV